MSRPQLIPVARFHKDKPHRHFRRWGSLLVSVSQEELDRWRLDYNTVRPHGSLRRSTPAQVGAGAYLTPSPERLQNLRP